MQITVGTGNQVVKIPEVGGPDILDAKISGRVIETQFRAQDQCFKEKVDVLRCQSECRANFQLLLCGCLPWLYSRFIYYRGQNFSNYLTALWSQWSLNFKRICLATVF